MSAALDDSVPLTKLATGGAGTAGADPDGGGGATGRKRRRPRLGATGAKAMLALFAMFVLVVSDVFTNSVLPLFGEKAVQGRSPTTWGVVLQGIFLVIGYAALLHLVDSGVL